MRFILLLSLLVACTGSDRGSSTPVPSPATSTSTAAATATVATVSSAAFDPAATQPDSTPPRFDAAGHPILPIVMRDYCQGEDCGTRYVALACLPTGLLGAPRDLAPVVTPLAAGDTVEVLRRDLRVPAVGVVVVRKSVVLDTEMTEAAGGDVPMPRSDTIRLARGDTLYVLSYLALGRWRWAYHGQLHDSDQFWASATEFGLGAPSTDSSVAVALTAVKSEDWWYVRPRHGAVGWWHGDDRVELQSTFDMQKEGDDCAQVAKRAAAARRRGP
jgi:hypothetical protein